MRNHATPITEKSPLANTVPPPSGRPSAQENEGEGSRSAARNYDEATEQYVKSGRVEKAAKEAEAALEGPEGDTLREAELAARPTAPGEEEPPTTRAGAQEEEEKESEEKDEGFKVPELMKDESEDRE